MFHPQPNFVPAGYLVKVPQFLSHPVDAWKTHATPTCVCLGPALQLSMMGRVRSPGNPSAGCGSALLVQYRGEGPSPFARCIAQSAAVGSTRRSQHIKQPVPWIVATPRAWYFSVRNSRTCVACNLNSTDTWAKKTQSLDLHITGSSFTTHAAPKGCCTQLPSSLLPGRTRSEIFLISSSPQLCLRTCCPPRPAVWLAWLLPTRPRSGIACVKPAEG